MLHPRKTFRQHYGLWLFSSQARPLRFIFTGGITGLLQIGLLYLLLHYGWIATIANITAFLLSAQINFLLSRFFTWHDRQHHQDQRETLLKRWLAFHSSIASTALLNYGVFLATYTFLPTLLASALGIGVAALVNFIALNWFVFRPRLSTKQDTLPEEMPATRQHIPQLSQSLASKHKEMGIR